MMIRSDHAASLAFILLGVAVFAVGTDLPFGSLSAPGAGMMPKLMAVLMMAFAVVVAISGRDSPPLRSLGWHDLSHAIPLVLIAAAGIALYRPLGFLVTMSAMVFTLLVAVERRPVLTAALYSAGLTLFAYWLFSKALKAPLERGVLWF